MSVKKQYLKGKTVCKVTFTLAKGAAGDATKAHVVGDFNNWDVKATPMKKLKNGSFAATANLDSGKEYQFRYLLDGTIWENDWSADKYVANRYGGENSVVVI